jgi:hypothetical protein
MTSTSRTHTRGSDTVVSNRLFQASIIAFAAVVANMLIYYIVPALFDFELDVPWAGPGTEIERLPVLVVILTLVIVTIGAIAVLAALKRFTARPVTTFRVVAAALALLSLGPLTSLPVDLNVKLTLAAMHIISAAIITYMLTTREA